MLYAVAEPFVVIDPTAVLVVGVPEKNDIKSVELLLVNARIPGYVLLFSAAIPPIPLVAFG